MAERAESEIRRYACCIDNLKAEIVFSIINIILNIVGIVFAIIYVVVPTAKLLDWNFVVSTYFENICHFLYIPIFSPFLPFQCCTNKWALILSLGILCIIQVMAFAFFAAMGVVLPILISIFIMVKDSMLLHGSIKQRKGPLIGGAIMEGITLLGLLGIGIYFIYTFFESYSKGYMANPIVTSIPWIIFAFKLWNFLIIVGAIQEVELINQREETAIEMSYMAVAQNESQDNKDAN